MRPKIRDSSTLVVFSIPTFSKYTQLIDLCINQIHTWRAGCVSQGQVLSCLELFSLWNGFLTQVKEPSRLYYSLITEGEKIDLCLSQEH